MAIRVSANVSLGPNSLHVMRESAWLALIRDCQSYAEGPGMRLVVLPDSATVVDLLAAIDKARAPIVQPLPPIA